MTPQPKRVFVLDDDVTHLEIYVTELINHGFDVTGVKSLDEVDKLLEAKQRFDLLLLDMQLTKDPRAFESNTYGSDVGQLFINQAAWPPEVLTMTQFSADVDIWRRSSAIRPTVHLEKVGLSPEEIVNYVCALLLRRGLDLNNPICKQTAGKVLENGYQYQMFEDFFLQLVLPEFAACIDSPYILVLENNEAADREMSYAQLSLSMAPLRVLKQEIAEIVTKAAYYTHLTELKEPFLFNQTVFELSPLPRDKTWSQVFLSLPLGESFDLAQAANSAYSLPELLQDAAFVPFQLTTNIRLSLLLLKDGKSRNSTALLPLPRAKLLAKYTLDSLRITLTNLIERWNHEKEIKEVQLRELARFCEYVGIETKRISLGLESEGGMPEENSNLFRLTLLGDELCEAGDFLNGLFEGSVHVPRRLVVQEIIKDTWDRIKLSSFGPSVLLSFHGDCRATVMASNEELFFLFSRLLHWLVSFFDEGTFDTPQIKVGCGLAGSDIQLSFESNSVRLHKVLRDKLFVPMTQRIDYDQVLDSKGPKLFLALHLAKTILEKRYNGNLADHSDELSEGVGHKLVVSLPVLIQ